MFSSISRLWSAMGSLAAALQALAGTVAEADRGLRAQLRLDAPAEPEQLPPGQVLEHVAEPSANNGRGRRRQATTPNQE